MIGEAATAGSLLSKVERVWLVGDTDVLHDISFYEWTKENAPRISPGGVEL